MPNHFHTILEIVGATLVVAQNDVNIQNVVVTPYETVVLNENGEFNTQGQPQGIAPTGKTIGDMVGAFESITAVEYIRGVKNNNREIFDKKLWQRNYWEHIIRNEESYFKISEYIVNNAANWNYDTLKPI
jgi:putative transposase